MIAQYLKQFVQLVFAPARGWEDIDRDLGQQFLASCERRLESGNDAGNGSFSDRQNAWEDARANRCFRCCFLPVITGFALSWLIRALYGTDDLLSCVQKAIVTFVTLFLTSQFARYIFLVYMPRLLSPICCTDPKGRWLIVIMQCLTFLGLITFLSNAVKAHLALIEFLPFYVIFIIWKSWKFAGIEERNVGLFMIIATLSILGPVYLLSLLLNALI